MKSAGGWALDGVGQLGGDHPMHLKAASSIPSEGICLYFGLDPP